VVWAGIILFIGGQSDVPTVDTTLPVDKVAHFVMYGILGLLATLAWQRTRRPARLLVPLLFAALVGVTDELHQRSVPNRSSDYKDFAADVIGIAVASSTFLRFKKSNVV
jgi:VanZ family protein